MAPSDRPKARQSQLVTTYGVGSLFPAGDQSLMICGIDSWDERFSPEIEEPRLARSLGVRTFRSPSSGRKIGDVPVVRFPEYHYCPECRRLDPFWKFDPRKMKCNDCDRDITPSRFVACCEDGHIEDFPYFNWVHRGAEGAPGGRHQLKLTTRGASSSLADIVISCTCGVKSYDLDGSFSYSALRQIKSCGGKRPWLPDAQPDQCTKPLRVLQRGSSNVWFGAVRSAISIPPWSSPDARFVNKYWTVLKQFPEESLEVALPAFAASEPGVSIEGVADLIRRRHTFDDAEPPTEVDLRNDEYFALRDGSVTRGDDTFTCREVEVSPRLSGVVAQVSAVDRLREVRALHGFTRVTASATATATPRMAKLSSRLTDWLPATEVLGEGIFIRLDERVVHQWESTGLASHRRGLLADSLELRAREAGIDAMPAPTARFLALHTLAHAVLKELSLDAGYPTGALRERVYAEEGQAGFLVYTASSDAAGSLGGLAALSSPEPLARAIEGALARAAWCSNDPVCSESVPSGSDGLNLAACHACMLLPETSCESKNIYLDRALLIGDLEEGGGLADALLA
ncbi:DrmB family protein [Salinibacterium sp. ZJ70]|uniref:DrmB family protein n=1 Tax=Salinibacterium sp. ZJ70 TaxID=2708084 RepID=UPI001CD63F93|nr:DrmB family protein [Salinibacterium sp. ZJ70]